MYCNLMWINLKPRFSKLLASEVTARIATSHWPPQLRSYIELAQDPCHQHQISSVILLLRVKKANRGKDSQDYSRITKGKPPQITSHCRRTILEFEPPLICPNLNKAGKASLKNRLQLELSSLTTARRSVRARIPN